MEIPTKERFEQMGFDDKQKVKETLMRKNYSRLCNAINPQSLPHFAPVLHRGDLEELELSRRRDSKAMIISDLLGRIKRSLKKDPTWWDLLDDLLREESPELYYRLNPWETQSAGAASGAEGRVGAGRRRGTAPSRRNPNEPSIPIVGNERPLVHHPLGKDAPNFLPLNKIGYHPTMRAPDPMPPYSMDTPLALTRKIDLELGCLLEGGDDMLWRDLANNLGLGLGVQLEIMKQSNEDNIHFHLLDHYIQRYDNAATVGALLDALLSLGQVGKQVVQKLEDKGLILPLAREGSEAVGFVESITLQSDGHGSTSAQAVSAPTPTLGCSVPTPDNNFHHSSQQNVVKLNVQPDRLVFAGTDLGSSAEEHARGSTESNSIVDNTNQPLTSTTMPVVDKKLNNKEEATENDECRYPKQGMSSVQTHCPALRFQGVDRGESLETSPPQLQAVPQNIRKSQQDILDQMIPADIAQTTQTEGSVSINILNINNAAYVLIGGETRTQTSRDSETEADESVGHGETAGGEDDDGSPAIVKPTSPVSTEHFQHHFFSSEGAKLPTPVSEVSQEQLLGNYTQATSGFFSILSDSTHPPAWNTEAQETYVKQPFTMEADTEESIQRGENADMVDASSRSFSFPSDSIHPTGFDTENQGTYFKLPLMTEAESKENASKAHEEEPSTQEQNIVDLRNCNSDSEESVFFSNVCFSDQPMGGSLASAGHIMSDLKADLGSVNRQDVENCNPHNSTHCSASAADIDLDAQHQALQQEQPQRPPPQQQPLHSLPSPEQAHLQLPPQHMPQPQNAQVKQQYSPLHPAGSARTVAFQIFTWIKDAHPHI